jgi:hypothetical protein
MYADIKSRMSRVVEHMKGTVGRDNTIPDYIDSSSSRVALDPTTQHGSRGFDTGIVPSSTPSRIPHSILSTADEVLPSSENPPHGSDPPIYESRLVTPSEQSDSHSVQIQEEDEGLSTHRHSFFKAPFVADHLSPLPIPTVPTGCGGEEDREMTLDESVVNPMPLIPSGQLSWSLSVPAQPPRSL